MSNKNSCPEEQDIFDYIISVGEGSQDPAMAQHLIECEKCARISEDMNDFEDKLNVLDSETPSQERDNSSHEVLGKYKIISKIGEGGMGKVLKGFDPDLNRYVAIKVLKKELSQDQEFKKRFLAEAHIVAQLNHPNVIHIYNLGEEEGQMYLVMEFVDGVTISQYPIMDRSDVVNVCSLFSQILTGIKSAHSKGIIHRDIKSSNVMLNKEGVVKILDFGLARSVIEEQHLTLPNTILGTVAYMAPEIARGEKASFQSDIYSLGIILFELFTGELPFQSSTPLEIIEKIKTERILFTHDNGKSIPESIQLIIKKLCHKDLSKRYSDIAEIEKDLSSIGDRSHGLDLPNAAPSVTRDIEGNHIETTNFIRQSGIAQDDIPKVISMAQQIEQEQMEMAHDETIISIAEEMSISPESARAGIEKFHQMNKETKLSDHSKGFTFNPEFTKMVLYGVALGLCAFLLIFGYKKSSLFFSGSQSETQWTVLFCSKDPSIWNTKTNDNEMHRSILIEEAPDDMEYLRLTNVKTKEFVIISLTKPRLSRDVELGNGICWNGSNQRISSTTDGKQHVSYLLGIYNKNWPGNYKASFPIIKRENKSRSIGYGGWGFARRHVVFSSQRYTWEKNQIEPVPFEISISKTINSEEKNHLLR
ncbi:MAG: serine/threonine protein kinase [Planctomycetes bacterium]|nr:serine/threonine protein kinase [Planctomycetota bacterium]